MQAAGELAMIQHGIIVKLTIGWAMLPSFQLKRRGEKESLMARAGAVEVHPGRPMKLGNVHHMTLSKVFHTTCIQIVFETNVNVILGCFIAQKANRVI